MEVLLVVIGCITIIIILITLKLIPSTGTRGEYIIAKELKRLNTNEYYVLNDVMIQTQYGSSQIDHVVISVYGIFVIETKNYKGWIHGNEKSTFWNQTVYSKKYQFRNPVKQNWSHIYALKEIISLVNQKFIPYYPIVVFVGTARLVNVNVKTPVIYKHQLIQTIKDEQNTSLSIDQVRHIAHQISTNIEHNKVTNKEHFNNIQSAVYTRQQLERNLICPRCGSKLIIRNGKYGKFYGCSKYPYCKYTLSKLK